jgi:hypothetical protein
LPVTLVIARADDAKFIKMVHPRCLLTPSPRTSFMSLRFRPSVFSLWQTPPEAPLALRRAVIENSGRRPAGFAGQQRRARWSWAAAPPSADFVGRYTTKARFAWWCTVIDAIINWRNRAITACYWRDSTAEKHQENHRLGLPGLKCAKWKLGGRNRPKGKPVQLHHFGQRNPKP